MGPPAWLDRITEGNRGHWMEAVILQRAYGGILLPCLAYDLAARVISLIL